MNRLGVFEVRSTGELRSLHGETVSDEQQPGTAAIDVVAGPGGLNLEIADVRWWNGERDVRALDRGESDQRFDRLCDGLRLGVMRLTDGRLWSELSQARIKPTGRSNLFQADEAALDYGAGVSVTTTILALGALEAGTRDVVLGDGTNRRNRWCVVYLEEASLVPVAAYVLTRVAPIQHLVAA